MQLALRGKRLLVKRVAILLMVLVVFCAPLVKPPIKVEAVAVPVVTGAAIVAAAMSALGIGVAAGFDTDALAEGAQKVWDDLSDSVRNAIVLTEIAGHTVAHFTEQALRDIYSGLVNTFPETSVVPVSATQISDFFTASGVEHGDWFIWDNRLASGYGSYFTSSAMSNISNLRFIGTVSAPETFMQYAPVTIPNGITLALDNNDNTILPYVFFSPKTTSIIPNTSHVASFSQEPNSSTNQSNTWDMSFSLGSTFSVILFDYISSSGSYTYTYIISTSVQSNGTFSWIPAFVYKYPLADVYNPADEKFYADGMSILNNKLDDVLNRLKDQVGETGQISDQPDVITVPGQIVGDSVTDQTKGADQAGTIGKDISTEADKAANDATNADRDTTKPSTPGEDTDIPDLSLPQIITTKFPFSIPWDLYRAVNILVAPAQAPKWDMPLRFDALNVNTTITIDMARFDGLAALLRWGLSLLFLISLIILTSSIIKR